MHRIAKVGLALVLGFAVVLPAGCGGRGGGASGSADAQDAFHQNTMNEVGEILAIRKSDSNNPPASMADLTKYQNGWPSGFMAIKKGDIVVIWGAPIQEGASDKVLAHEKQAPESGGFVLMQDAKTVKKMSAEDFKAAPKAAK